MQHVISHTYVTLCMLLLFVGGAFAFWEIDRGTSAEARIARIADGGDRLAIRLEHEIHGAPEAVPVARHGERREVEAEVVRLLGFHTHVVRSAVLPRDLQRAQVVLPGSSGS